MKYQQYENMINKFAAEAVDQGLEAPAAADKLVAQNPSVRRRNAYKDLRHAIKKHQNGEAWRCLGNENYR